MRAATNYFYCPRKCGKVAGFLVRTRSVVSPHNFSFFFRFSARHQCLVDHDVISFPPTAISKKSAFLLLFGIGKIVVSVSFKRFFLQFYPKTPSLHLLFHSGACLVFLGKVIDQQSHKILFPTKNTI